MNEYIYDRMNSVTVKNGNNEYIFNCITGVDEYDHEIVVESGVQIDGLTRGFIGDLFYRAKGACTAPFFISSNSSYCIFLLSILLCPL